MHPENRRYWCEVELDIGHTRRQRWPELLLFGSSEETKFRGLRGGWITPSLSLRSGR